MDIYLQRDADKQIFATLHSKDHCYVLAPSQSGKSRLIKQARNQLESVGIRTGYIELNLLQSPSEIGILSWFQKLIIEIDRSKMKTVHSSSQIHAHHIKSTDQVAPYIIDNLWIPDDVVLFFDEINILENYPLLKEPFLKMLLQLRSPGLSRLDRPQRITFCLVGNVMMNLLGPDYSKTVFGFAKEIPIRDFSRAQLSPLHRWFSQFRNKFGDETHVIQSVYDLTLGHPLLTYETCLHLEENLEIAINLESTLNIEALIKRPKIREYIEHVESRILDSQCSRQLLQLYGRIVDSDKESQKHYIADDLNHELIMSGIAKIEADKGTKQLRVRNPILAKFFDINWVRHARSEKSSTRHVQEFVAHNGNYVVSGIDLVRLTNELADQSTLDRNVRYLLANSMRQMVADAEVAQKLADKQVTDARNQARHAQLMADAARSAQNQAEKARLEAEIRAQVEADQAKARAAEIDLRAVAAQGQAKIKKIQHQAVALGLIIALSFCAIIIVLLLNRQLDSKTREAEKAKQTAVLEKEKAEAAIGVAIREKEKAEAAIGAAIREKEKAEAARQTAAREKERAETAKDEAIRQKEKAEQIIRNNKTLYAKYQDAKKSSINNLKLGKSLQNSLNELQTTYSMKNCKQLTGDWCCKEEKCNNLLRKFVHDLGQIQHTYGDKSPAD